MAGSNDIQLRLSIEALLKINKQLKEENKQLKEEYANDMGDMEEQHENYKKKIGYWLSDIRNGEHELLDFLLNECDISKYCLFN